MPQAVLLAAGHAERLMPLTESRPKAMLLVGGKPLLQHAVEALASHGVTDIIIVVGRHGEKIQSFFKDGADFGVATRYAHQATPTGTTDALCAARPQMDGDAWVLSAAVFVTPDDLAPLLKGTGDAVVVAPAGDAHLQPVPAVRGDRLAAVRRERPVVGSTRVATGILRLSRDTVQELEEDGSDIEDALGRRVEAGGDVRVLPMQGTWHRLIEPWDLLRLNEHVLNGLPRRREGVPRGPRATGAVRVGANTDIAPTATLVGPVTIGDGCTVGDYTVIGPYVSVRNNTIIGAHCEVRRSILNNNVALDSHGLVRGCILDDGVQVGPGFVGHEESTPQGPVGCIVGRDAVLGAGVRTRGGAVLEPEGSVAAGRMLS